MEREVAKKKKPKYAKNDVPRQPKADVGATAYLQMRTLLPQMDQREKDGGPAVRVMTNWVRCEVKSKCSQTGYWMIEVPFFRRQVGFAREEFVTSKPCSYVSPDAHVAAENVGAAATPVAPHTEIGHIPMHASDDSSDPLPAAAQHDHPVQGSSGLDAILPDADIEAPTPNAAADTLSGPAAAVLGNAVLVSVNPSTNSAPDSADQIPEPPAHPPTDVLPPPVRDLPVPPPPPPIGPWNPGTPHATFRVGRGLSAYAWTNLTPAQQVQDRGLKTRHAGPTPTVTMDGELKDILYRNYHNETAETHKEMVGRMNHAAKLFNARGNMTVDGMQRYRQLLLLGKLYPARGVLGMFSNAKRGHRSPPNFGKYQSKTDFEKYHRWFPWAFAEDVDLEFGLESAGKQKSAGVSRAPRLCLVVAPQCQRQHVCVCHKKKRGVAVLLSLRLWCSPHRCAAWLVVLGGLVELVELVELAELVELVVPVYE